MSLVHVGYKLIITFQTCQVGKILEVIMAISRGPHWVTLPSIGRIGDETQNLLRNGSVKVGSLFGL